MKAAVMNAPKLSAKVVFERLTHRRNTIAILWRVHVEPAIIGPDANLTPGNFEAWYVAFDRVTRQMAALDVAIKRTGYTV